MTDRPGVPARELSDEELERQGVHAHAMRHWVFLHGTAEQFRTHTERMLELEQEYLRRHPQRTWQGTGGEAQAPPATTASATSCRRSPGRSPPCSTSSRLPPPIRAPLGATPCRRRSLC